MTSWTDPTNPVPATVITAAYAIANFINQLLHLRNMTGNADPPASNRVVVSSSTSATAWGQIPTDAIADRAVTNGKISLGTITAELIQDGQITTAKLTDGAVTTVKITDANVTAAKLADGSVTNAKIGDAQISVLKIQDGQVSAAKLSSGAAASNLGTGGVTTTLLATDAVTTAKVTDANITFAKLATSVWKAGKTGEFTGSQALTTSHADLSGASWSADRDGMWLVLLNAEYTMLVGDGVPSAQIVAGGSPQEEGFGVVVAGVTTISASTTIALVTVSGATTIKAQAKKAAGSAGSIATYAKITGIWLSP